MRFLYKDVWNFPVIKRMQKSIAISYPLHSSAASARTLGGVVAESHHFTARARSVVSDGGIVSRVIDPFLLYRY
jgi:hypothetical protein